MDEAISFKVLQGESALVSDDRDYQASPWLEQRVTGQGDVAQQGQRSHSAKLMLHGRCNIDRHFRDKDNKHKTLIRRSAYRLPRRLRYPSCSSARMMTSWSDIRPRRVSSNNRTECCNSAKKGMFFQIVFAM